MIVLKSEQIMRAESERGAWSTELHGCYRRLLLMNSLGVFVDRNSQMIPLQCAF